MHLTCSSPLPLLLRQQVFVGPFLRRSERSSDSETKYTNVFVKNLEECESTAQQLGYKWP